MNAIVRNRSPVRGLDVHIWARKAAQGVEAKGRVFNQDWTIDLSDGQ